MVLPQAQFFVERQGAAAVGEGLVVALAVVQHVGQVVVAIGGLLGVRAAQALQQAEAPAGGGFGVRVALGADVDHGQVVLKFGVGKGGRV